ncbi:reverse transcriptase domain-containing protein [Tanacetum coccineum]
MLERLTGNEFYCFLDGFSGYFQIPIDPQDQEKTTFTCPYGTFAYRRMPFGLRNAPGTFQMCMVAIFHDMIEKTMKEKCHFMVKGGIILGHKISKSGIEVDRAKVDVIAKLPPSTTAYKNSLIYKEKTKNIHDAKIKNQEFHIGDRVLLFNSKLKIFSGKLKSRWSGPFTVVEVFPYGTVVLSQPYGHNFKVNGHRIKHYFGGDIPAMDVPDLHLSP